ncbi:MAG: 3'-5' exoribonuclease YhaM family protein [Planctomycetota bacterium]|jgi:3'-5' exoribonuclease
MPKINELSEGDHIEGFYALCSATLRDTRAGSQFIRLQLGDSTGTISANLWDANDALFQEYTGADIVKVRAIVESYQGSKQFKIIKIRPADRSECDLSELIQETPFDRTELLTEVHQLVNAMTDPDYKALINLFLDDPEVVEGFTTAPAAKENHHAYLGGLLEHTASMMRLCDQYARNNSHLRRDLLLCGAFFHDLGKMEEMKIGTSIEYTTEGMLIGHLVQGVMMIEDRLTAIPDFPRDKRNLVFHLVLSHHGKREYGSPILPAIPEALALHQIDNLDAKVFAANRIIDNDTNTTSEWTERSWMLETKLFKG